MTFYHYNRSLTFLLNNSILNQTTKITQLHLHRSEPLTLNTNKLEEQQKRGKTW